MQSELKSLAAMQGQELPKLTAFLDSPRLIYAPPYPAVGGYRREEAIMLLRRFYISENATGTARTSRSGSQF